MKGASLFPKPFKQFVYGVLRVVAVFACLYFFICSLDLLTVSFRLLSGQSGGQLFSESELLHNPIVGVMIGVIGTVLVQSSSTTTSIIVGMVASGILTIDSAIPMVMGANIGTSVTNTIVSFTQVTDRQNFERSFACAVLHDMFNWLSVLTFLILEVITGYLHALSEVVVDSFHLESAGEHPPDFLKTLTKPLTDKVIKIDKKVLEGWLQNSNETLNITTLLKADCERNVSYFEHPFASLNSTSDYKIELYECGYLFANLGIGDIAIGVILFIASFLILTSCLILLVKVLNSLMEAQVARLIQKILNANIPFAPWLTGYFAIVAGALLTILVQSSSVFTCTLTPLVGTGFFELERAYPMTLGSNIGTTTTGILAALATEGESIKPALRIALCHLFFNISGILVYYPIPFMRWPLPMARAMGRTVAQYRWFAIVYLIATFILFPLIVFNVSLLIGADLAIYGLVIPLIALTVLISAINVIQNTRPQWLPKVLKDWSFLPLFMRSLEPYDRIFQKCVCCSKKEDKENQEDEHELPKYALHGIQDNL